MSVHLDVGFATEICDPLDISKIIRGQKAITADTDLRLCRLLGLSAGGGAGSHRTVDALLRPH